MMVLYFKCKVSAHIDVHHKDTPFLYSFPLLIPPIPNGVKHYRSTTLYGGSMLIVLVLVLPSSAFVSSFLLFDATMPLFASIFACSLLFRSFEGRLSSTSIPGGRPSLRAMPSKVPVLLVLTISFESFSSASDSSLFFFIFRHARLQRPSIALHRSPHHLIPLVLFRLPMRRKNGIVTVAKVIPNAQ